MQAPQSTRLDHVNRQERRQESKEKTKQRQEAETAYVSVALQLPELHAQGFHKVSLYPHDKLLFCLFSYFEMDFYYLPTTTKKNPN